MSKEDSRQLAKLLKITSEMTSIEVTAPKREQVIKPEKRKAWTYLRMFITTLQNGMFDLRIPAQERQELLRLAAQSGGELFRENPELFPPNVGSLVIQNHEFPGSDPLKLVVKRTDITEDQIMKLQSWTADDFHQHLATIIFPSWKA